MNAVADASPNPSSFIQVYERQRAARIAFTDLSRWPRWSFEWATNATGPWRQAVLITNADPTKIVIDTGISNYAMTFYRLVPFPAPPPVK